MPYNFVADSFHTKKLSSRQTDRQTDERTDGQNSHR